MNYLSFIKAFIFATLILSFTSLTMASEDAKKPENYAQILAKHDLCVATHREKKYKEAISVCTDAIKVANHNLNISLLYGYRASSYFRLGDKTNAKKDLDVGDKIGGKTREFVYMVLGDDI